MKKILCLILFVASCLSVEAQYQPRVSASSTNDLRTGTTAGNTATVRGYNTGNSTYQTFVTVTANGTPTYDISLAATWDGQTKAQMQDSAVAAAAAALIPINLASQVTGTLPLANGGIGTTSLATLATNMGIIRKVKATAEIVNNSTTLQNDDDFSFAIGANETWYVELYLVYDSVTTTPRIKFDFTGPASPTAVVYEGMQIGNSSVNTSGRKNAFSTAAAITPGAASDIFVIHLVVANGVNAGTIQFRWAQNTLTAENTTLSIGTSMLAFKMN